MGLNHRKTKTFNALWMWKGLFTASLVLLLVISVKYASVCSQVENYQKMDTDVNYRAWAKEFLKEASEGV